MKIIFVNCGVRNYMKEDHCSYRRNCKSCAITAMIYFIIQTLYNFFTPQFTFMIFIYS